MEDLQIGRHTGRSSVKITNYFPTSVLEIDLCSPLKALRGQADVASAKCLGPDIAKAVIGERAVPPRAGGRC